MSGPIRREQSQSAAWQHNMHPNSCETLRSKFEKWFSITNVLLRFRQKRWGGGQDWQCHRWLPSYYHQLIGGAPAAGAGTTKKQKQQSPLSSFVHSQTGMFSNLIYNYVCILCGRPQKTSWLLRAAKIMKNNLFSRQNPCYGLTITGGHGPLGWRSFVSRQRERGRLRVEERDVTSDN